MNSFGPLKVALVALTLSGPAAASKTYKPPELSPDQVDRICQIVANNSSEVLGVNICPPVQVNKIPTPAVTSTIDSRSRLTLPPDTIDPITKEELVPTKETTKKNEGLDNEAVLGLATLAALGLGGAFFWRKRRTLAPTKKTAMNDLRDMGSTPIPDSEVVVDGGDIPGIDMSIAEGKTVLSVDEKKAALLEIFKNLAIDTPGTFEEGEGYYHLDFELIFRKQTPTKFRVYITKDGAITFTKHDPEIAESMRVLRSDQQWHKDPSNQDSVTIETIENAMRSIQEMRSAFRLGGYISIVETPLEQWRVNTDRNTVESPNPEIVAAWTVEAPPQEYPEIPKAEEPFDPR